MPTIKTQIEELKELLKILDHKEIDFLNLYLEGEKSELDHKLKKELLERMFIILPDLITEYDWKVSQAQSYADECKHQYAKSKRERVTGLKEAQSLIENHEVFTTSARDALAEIHNQISSTIDTLENDNEQDK